MAVVIVGDLCQWRSGATRRQQGIRILVEFQELIDFQSLPICRMCSMCHVHPI